MKEKEPIHDVLKVVEAMREKTNTSKTELAEGAKISRAMYYEYLKGSKCPLDVADRLGGVFGMSLTWKIENKIIL